MQYNCTHVILSKFSYYVNLGMFNVIQKLYELKIFLLRMSENMLWPLGSLSLLPEFNRYPKLLFLHFDECSRWQMHMNQLIYELQTKHKTGI